MVAPMKRPRVIRYAHALGEAVFSVHEHARACAHVCAEAVRNGRRDVEPEKHIEPVIEERLTTAFEAGVRQGRAELQAELESIIRERVRKAVEGIGLEPAKCPHCIGGRADAGDCDECRGTGRLRA